MKFWVKFTVKSSDVWFFAPAIARIVSLAETYALLDQNLRHPFQVKKRGRSKANWRSSWQVCGMG